MKLPRIFFLSFALLLCVPAAAQQLDTAKLSSLSSKLEEYFAALRGEPASVQEKEADFIIGTCKDSLVRQFVAIKVYGHYLSSPIMGDESVAVHIADYWFSSGKVKMKNDIDLMNARIFAEFNRQSLIGCKAPSLRVQSFSGDSLDIFSGRKGRYSVVYFYATDCAKCKLETPLLCNMLSRDDFPVDFYAFYVGDDRKAWTDYVERYFDFKTSRMRIGNLWDASLDSDFQKKYGVIQTPRLFLVNPQGEIIGRGLDYAALEIMLKNVRSSADYEYGGDESKAMFDKIASGQGKGNDFESVGKTAAYISEKTLEKGDTLLYKHLTGDYLYWLTGRRSEGYEQAMGGFIEKYVLNGIFDTGDDSLKVVGLAKMMQGLLSRTAIGTKVPDLRVHSLEVTYRDAKAGNVQPVPDFDKAEPTSLRKLHNKTSYILFYTEGCPVCKREISAVDSLLRTERRAKVFLIDVDKVLADYPDEAKSILDAFDLSVLPYAISMDRKGIIKRKYLSFAAH